ncbi:hypothetical protein LXL04_008042 [Taraxacum kok-saghyz]
MRAEVRTRFGLNVSVGQCRNAKAFALDEISGSLNDQYEKLWRYGAELVRANPGSTVRIQVDPMPDSTVYFNRMYVCFKGVKDGWIEGCRRVIGIDGCFLKGICRGELLSAVGRDANNQMYPLAWAVVSVENKETWKWFIDLLLNDIDMVDGAGLTFISDQHKGLVEAVKERAPASEHRQCARHIYANFKKSYSGVEFRKLFWFASKATTEQLFLSYMREIRQLDPAAHQHLFAKERDPNTLCRAFFEPDRCCDAVENGVSESFNAAIMEARKKPIITMLEEIRVYVMERMYRQKVKGDKWELDIGPSIRRKIEKNKEIQRYWEVTPIGPEQYEVKKAHEVYAVDLEENTCGCRSWQLTGIPCVHGIAAILFLNGNPEDYVAVWFQTKVFSSCYRYTIKPINGADMWPKVDANTIFPPRRRRLPGRPKVSRKKCPSEKEGRHTVTKKGVVPKCGNCHQSGHNKRRCPLLNPVAPDQSPVAEEEQPDPVPVVEEEVEADHEEAEANHEANLVPVEEEADHVGKRRRPSERITKLKLRKNVVTPDGSGGNLDFVVADLEEEDEETIFSYAGTEDMADTGNPRIEVYCRGMFYHKPFMYFDLTIFNIEGVDFKSMSFTEFKVFLHKTTDHNSPHIYFCPHDDILSEGLHSLQNECDYNEFLECAYGEQLCVDVYIDDLGEPVFEWIQMEEPEEEEEETYVYEEDVDFELLDNEQPDFEPEDEDVAIRCRRRVNDHFLNKLCPAEYDGIVEEEQGDPRPVWSVHDTSAEWDKMSLELGMKFANPYDLKSCLSNYVVHHGYALWHQKNDKNRLLVRCCKDKIPECPFRLWASWMKIEETFHIKSLIPDHNCSRAFKLGPMVTYKWIGKQYGNDILLRPRMSLRKMKAEISKEI